MVNPPPLCILVFSNRHELAFMDAILAQCPTVLCYVMHDDGALAARRGPHLHRVSDLRASHVVWVGVPIRLAVKLVGADDLFKSHYVESKARPSRAQSSVMVARTVNVVLETAAAEAARAEQAQEEERVAVIEEMRQRRTGQPAPWFIPGSLS